MLRVQSQMNPKARLLAMIGRFTSTRYSRFGFLALRDLATQPPLGVTAARVGKQVGLEGLRRPYYIIAKP